MKAKIPAPVFLLLAILLASGGVFLLLQYKPWMQFFQNVRPGPAIPRDASVSTEFTQARDQWIEYRGHNGLYFKYPPEWRADEITPSMMVLYTAELLEPPKGAPITISRNDFKSYETLVGDIRGAIKEAQERTVTIGNLQGIEFIGFIQATVVGRTPVVTTVLNFEDHAVVAEYASFPEAPDYTQAYHDILATLEVTAAQSSPAPSPEG